MNAKRIRFALFICVFALYGCASSASVTSGKLNIANIESKASLEDAAHTSILLSTQKQESPAFLAYGPKKENAYLYQQLRDEHGELTTKKALRKFSHQMNEKVKAERARLAKEKKAKAQQARLKKMEENSISTFYPLITTYGVDCYGCQVDGGRGGTSLGVALDLSLGVKMPDGSWQPGIKYGNYYIVAADPSIPLCSILKISDHGLSGSGISPEKPYYAIVLDRGGAIQGSHLDLYIGSENSGAIVPVKNSKAKAQIIRLGGKKGANSCAL